MKTKPIRMSLKFLTFLTFTVFTCRLSFSQEANIFYSEPHEIKEFLGKNFKKIEIEIVKYRGNGADKTRMPGKSAYRIIEFNGTNSYTIINKTKDGDSDTTFYTYDNCGKLMKKKGNLVNSSYHNRYKNCKPMSKESNEWEMSNGSDHQWHLIRFAYDKAGKLEKELIYDFSDSANILMSREYTYKGNNIDSMNEYYYQDAEKIGIRMTRYHYSSKLDSICYYNTPSILIDKKVYEYTPDGKIKNITVGSLGTCHYAYKNNVPDIISEEASGYREYWVTYFE